MLTTVTMPVTFCAGFSAVECDTNFITTLDLSNAGNLWHLRCQSNNLTYLNLKNGYDERIQNDINFSNNPSLSFICADSFQIASVIDSTIKYGMTGVAVTSNCSTLPLRLLTFSATPNNEDVMLNWQTTQAIKTSHFTIERSENATTFTSIGQSIRSFNSPDIHNYQFTDLNALKRNSKTIYYRLQIIDKDGKSKYSDVRSIKLQNNARYTMMPNPSKDFITISGKNIADITITDATGKQVMTTKAPRINISGLARGIYFVRIQSDDDNIQTEKLVVE